MKSTLKLVSKNNVILSFGLLLIGIGVSYCLVQLNPLIVFAGIAVLLGVVLILVNIERGPYILIISVFTFELTLGNALPFNLTPADIIVLALVISTFTIFSANKIKPIFAPVFFILMLFILVTFLSFLSSGVLGTLIPRSIQFIEFGLAAFILTQFFYKSNFWKPILAILLVGGAILGGIILFSTLFITNLTKNITILNTNSWQFLLDLIAPLSIAYSVVLKRKKSHTWIWPLSAIILFGVLASLSRGGYLGIAGGLIAIILISGPARWLKVLLFSIPIMFLIYLLVPDRVFTEVSDSNTLENIRAIQWQAIYNSFLQHPILGIGSGNLASISAVGSKIGDLSTVDPHNFVLRFAGESGILGVGCVLAIIVLTTRRALLNYFGLRKINIELAIFNLGIFGGIIAYTIHGFFDVFWVRGSGLLFWIFIGLAYASGFTLPEPTKNKLSTTAHKNAVGLK